MSIADKVAEFKKILELVVSVLPEVISLIKELVVCLKELKTV